MNRVLEGDVVASAVQGAQREGFGLLFPDLELRREIGKWDGVKISIY